MNMKHIYTTILKCFLACFVVAMIGEISADPQSAIAQVSPSAEKFTIEQVMSSPHPTNLIAAANSAKVAWVLNKEGARNIWVAEGPAYTGIQVTNYMEDNGQAVGDLQFTPDGRNIVFVYGGAPNRQGEIPNPLSSPDGAKRTVMIVSADGGEPQTLAEGSSPAVSPRGDIVVYVAGGQIWSVPLKGKDEPSQLLTIRGGPNSLTWSPDGSKLAFVSGRGDHSFIGIYELQNRSLIYLDPSVDSDSSPVWSPDGNRLAFRRTPNERNRLLFEPLRTAIPWSIHVSDVATGNTTVVWKADEGPGSAFRSINAANQIFWGSSDRIVFPWEKDGWTHLYSVSVRGGRATLLTPGDFEVQFVSITPNRSEMLYSSGEDDIDRQRIWRVLVSGGRAARITSQPGIEWAPVMTSDNAIAFLNSEGTVPAHASIKTRSNAPKPLAPDWLPADFPTSDLVEPEQVIFSGADGLEIHGQLFKPKNIRPGERLPALLFFHGGSRRQMLLGFHHSGYYHNAYSMNQYLASRGFIVVSVNYRSGIGYGLNFREALNYGAQGASEFNDVMGAGLYLQSRPDVDPGRIGLWGGSYGGFLTALGLSRASDLFAAGVDIHGVHDWNPVIKGFMPSYNAEARSEFARLAFESSPMSTVDGWRSPVLFIHGDDDRNVPFSETVSIIEEMRRLGVEYEQLIFPDEVHGFLLHKNWVNAYKAAADFFERKLMKK